MNPRFLNDGSDFRPRGSGGTFAKPNRDNGLFWWTILITLLMGLATFCWFFSIMVFRYPEKPFHYDLLTRLKRLEPLTKFDALKIPGGSFYGARELLSRYYNYNQEQLDMANDLLKRSYIMNYGSQAPVYVKGSYKVTVTRPLQTGDVISSGWVVRARSTELEDVEVEVLLPGADVKKSPYAVGDTISLDNKIHICCVINVERNQASDGICATVVPITYTGFTAGEQKQPIAMTPPERLNMEARWPVVAADTVPEPEKADPKVTAQATF